MPYSCIGSIKKKECMAERRAENKDREGGKGGEGSSLAGIELHQFYNSIFG